MQIAKYKIMDNFNSTENSRKFFTALDMKKIPTMTRSLDTKSFEVDSEYVPAVNMIATVIGSRIQLVSIRNNETLQGDSPFYGTVRHAIEFYGTTANIPNALRLFPGFLYNADKARISFIVANGTAMQRGVFSKTIYSTDPKVQEFNSIFSQANPRIDWSKVKAYDFSVNESQPEIIPTPKPVVNPSPNPAPSPGPRPNVNPTPRPPVPTVDPTKDVKKDEGSGIFIIGIIAVALYAFANSGKKKKGRR
jgi:hypothetical protein